VSNISEALINYSKDPTIGNENKVINEFKRIMALEELVQVPVFTEDGRYSYVILEHNDTKYAGLFISENKPKGIDEIPTVFVKLKDYVEEVFSIAGIDGVVIDPFRPERLYLSKRDLETYSGIRNLRKVKRNWISGIPEISDNDIMTDLDILDLAMDFLIPYFTNLAFNILEANVSRGLNSQLAIEKDEKISLVKILVNEDSISNEDKQSTINEAKTFGFDAYLAVVSLSSKDTERSENKLLICGDEYDFSVEKFEKLREA